MAFHHICCPCVSKVRKRKAYQYSYSQGPSERLKESALTQDEWNKFRMALMTINKRDYIIACIMHMFKLRSHEALDIKVGEFFLSNGGMFNLVFHDPIQGGPSLAYIFEEYCRKADGIDRKDMTIFITSKGRKITRHRLIYSFKRAGEQAGINKRVWPDMIRMVQQ